MTRNSRNVSVTILWIAIALTTQTISAKQRKAAPAPLQEVTPNRAEKALEEKLKEQREIEVDNALRK
ncbi:MAG: hypothetical protein AAFP93_01995 [Bacteroidota bacterium]